MEKNVTVPITSDKGLCGGINSTVTKYSRGTLRFTEGGLPSCYLHRFRSSSHKSEYSDSAFVFSGLHFFQGASDNRDAWFADGKEASLVVFGDKGRAQLSRFERPAIYSTVLDTAKATITFAQACLFMADSPWLGLSCCSY